MVDWGWDEWQRFHVGQAMDKNEVLYEQCDVLVPAAIGNVITSDNANKLNCQYVVEAANGPTTPNVGLLHAKYPHGNAYVCHIIC